MLNYLWSGMILIGILFAAFSGKMPDITTAALDSSKEAVTLCITMMGVMSFWTGLMGIAEKSGILKTATVRLSPLIHFLFPELPKDHPAEKPIAANIIANVLGLGWAATPVGLEAMEELQKLEEDRRLRFLQRSRHPLHHDDGRHVLLDRTHGNRRKIRHSENGS